MSILTHLLKPSGAKCPELSRAARTQASRGEADGGSLLICSSLFQRKDADLYLGNSWSNGWHYFVLATVRRVE